MMNISLTTLKPGLLKWECHLCFPELTENQVIGKERQVFAKSKRGTLTKIRLSVTEFNDGEKKYFTGMLHLV